jgi:hypothetical protein
MNAQIGLPVAFQIVAPDGNGGLYGILEDGGRHCVVA